LTLTKHAARENVKPFVSRSIYSFIVWQKKNKRTI